MATTMRGAAAGTREGAKQIAGSSLWTVPCTQCGALLTRFPSQMRGHVFCDRRCLGAFRSANGKAANNPYWRNGTKIVGGYIVVYAPWAACANVRGFAYLHRLVLEVHRGEPLPAHMVVHHCDGDKTNNAPSNLALMTQEAHAKLHNSFGRTSGAKSQ